MIKLGGMVRPHITVLDYELRCADEAGHERYKKHALQEAPQMARADHQVYRQQPNEKQNKFLDRKAPGSGIRRPEDRYH